MIGVMRGEMRGLVDERGDYTFKPSVLDGAL